MKTKNIFAKTLFLTVMFVIPGCSSFLDEENIAGQSAEEYFATAVGYESLINGCYNTLKSVYNTTNYNVISQLGTDIVTQNDIDAPSLATLNKYILYQSDNGFVYTQWTNLYAALKNVNAAIDRASNVITKTQDPRDGMDESILAKRVAEAKFFRAYEYFDLLQLFGDVIVVTEPIDITDPKMNAPRDDRSKVVDLIIEDLKQAIPDLPKENAIATADKGRVSQGAAQAFLSRVALYEGTWQKFRTGDVTRINDLLDIAAESAWEVIDSKQYEIFKPAELGTDAYKYLFILEDVQSNPANIKKDKNKEYIFSRRHDEVIAPIGKNITKNCFANVQWVTRKLAEMYLGADGLPIDNAQSTAGVDYSTPDNEYAKRDNRMTNTLMAPGRKYWNNNASHTTWTDADKAAFDNKDFYPTSGSGYNNQKWATERNVKDEYEGYDFPIIRYAEAVFPLCRSVTELCRSGI